MELRYYQGKLQYINMSTHGGNYTENWTDVPTVEKLGDYIGVERRRPVVDEKSKELWEKFEIILKEPSPNIVALSRELAKIAKDYYEK